MKVCIAGGGRVGMYLAQSLLSHHHKEMCIRDRCWTISCRRRTARLKRNLKL